MVFLAVFLGAAVLCCSVLLVFGCVCHLFKHHGFTNFEDEETGRDVSMYSTTESVNDSSNVTFEPLPDILAKTLSSRALRPRITCCEKENQSAAAKLVTIYKPFPRNQLLYIKEIGLGWFGQVLQGSAESILPESRHIKVVVKILKDDATANEKALFLEEVSPFRDLDHPNILQLLGQCTETTPFLAILEYPQLGDLKSYLLANNTGPLIQFAIDAAKGLAHMHKHSYIHHDFAARNCLLMSDMTLKVGDYGIGEDLYREDYYDTGRDLLPIRWMSPESLEVKQGVWQLKEFTLQSNVWSLSVLLWEIVCVGRKPYINLRDEDVLQKVIREGTTKLPPPTSDIPLHDRWFEIMEMCWQDVEDRPAAGDILAFLQQVEEEMTSQSHDLSAVTSVPVSQTGSQSPNSFDSKFVMSKNVNQSNHHVAEVLVHRVDDGEQKQGFDDDFSKSVKIRKNKGGGFEDDFIHGEENDSSYLSQNDTILACGGNSTEVDKDIFSADHNLNLLHPPVPVGMSTPSKQLVNGKPNLSDGYNTALSNRTSQSSNYVTASDGNLHVSAFNPDLVRSNNQSVSPFNSDFVRSDHANKHSSKQLFGEKSDNQNSDEGYRTGISGSAPDIVLNNNSDTNLTKHTPDLDTDNVSKETEDIDNIPQLTKLSPKFSDLETEKAKEIYMSKGAGLPSSIVHKSRSLGTIPEDGIPSDNTSQSGVVFDDPDVDMGMNFEWDDYEGEQLVGRVRYMSDESSASSARSPRQVDVEEWPFDQDSSSEGHSKPGSVASDSDAEVTRLSMGSNSSIDTRARIASILTNRLNSLIKQTNTSHSDQGMFYSFSHYDNDLDSPEHAFTDKDHSLGKASGDPDAHTVLSMPSERQEMEEFDTSEETVPQGQDGQFIKEDLDKIAASVLRKDDVLEVVVSQPHDQMLQNIVTDSLA